MALKGNAAFLVTLASGQELVYPLNAPLRDLRPRRLHRRFSSPSLDYSAVDTKTIGGPAYELVARCRFADQPQDLLDLLGYAAAGAPITYVHDLTTGEPGYDATLMLDGDAIELAPDPDRFAFAEYDVTVVLRSPTPFTRLLGPRDVLFRYRAGAPWPGPFERPSDATTIDRSGILRTAGPDVPRVTWRGGVPHLLVEGAGTNVIPGNRQQFEGWTMVGGAAVTITQGQTIQPTASAPGSPEGAATRIQTSGGTSTIKYLISAGSRPGSQAEAHSVLIYNQGANAVQVNTNGGGGTVTVEPGETAYVQTSTDASASTGETQLQLRATDAAHDLDFLAYGPQVEISPVATSYTPDTRATDLVRSPWHHPPQAMTIYLRFVELGAVLAADTRALLQIGTGGQAPRLLIAQSGGTGAYRVLHLGAGATVTSTLTTAPGLLDQVELVVHVYDDGSVQIEQAINGELVQSRPRSSAIGLSHAWSDSVLGLSNIPHSDDQYVAPAMWRDALVLRGSHWTLDAVRRLVG